MSTIQLNVKPASAFIVGALVVGMLASAGCSSALFFPAKPAEKAADKLINEIWPDIDRPAPPKAEAKKS